MKQLYHLLLALLAVCFISCTPLRPAVTEQYPRPDDFSVEYRWRAGSVPPPYHYEYAVLIQSSGQGQIVMKPGYSSTPVPTWTETFKVGAQDLNDLYRIMVDNGMFSQEWRKRAVPPVGGSHQMLVITAHGKQTHVEDYLVSEQQASARAMYNAVQELVPKELWECLQAKREQYMQKHSPR